MAGAPKLLTFDQIRRVALKHGNHPSGAFNVRDEALIAGAGFAHWTAIDLSLMRVEDLVQESGELYLDGCLSDTYHAGGKYRFFSIGKDTYFHSALTKVIEWRIANKLRLLDRGLYGGLNPKSRFFLQDDGSDFSVTYTERVGNTDLCEPHRLRRHFKNFLLGEGQSLNTLNDAFIINYWIARSSFGAVKARKELVERTGLNIETIRQKTTREEVTIKEFMETLYK